MKKKGEVIFFLMERKEEQAPGGQGRALGSLRSTEDAKCQTGRLKGRRKSQTQTFTLPPLDSYNVLSWQFPCEQFSEYSALSIIPRNIVLISRESVTYPTQFLGKMSSPT